MFDLRHEAKLVLKTHEDEQDPSVLASYLFQEVPAEEYPALLTGFLRSYIASLQSEIFRRTDNPTAWVEPREEAPQNWVDDHNDPNLTPKKRSFGRPSAAIRAHVAYRNWLQATLNVDGVRKCRADLTFEDLMSACAVRRSQGEKFHRWADKLEADAALLVQHGVTTLSELPEEVVREHIIGTGSSEAYDS